MKNLMKIFIDLTIAGVLAIILAACFDKPLEVVSSTSVEEDDQVSEEKAQCVSEVNVIASFNNAMSGQIKSFLGFIEESKEEIIRRDIEIIRLTASHFSCLYDGEPLEIPNTCSAYQDMVEYLISQRTAEPVKHNKKATYIRLIAEVERSLKNINANIKLL